MPWGGTGGGSTISGAVKGPVDAYANLPTASEHVGEFWAVKLDSGTELTDLGIYQYPKGIYTPNASNVWELAPQNVKATEDALSLTNVTVWSEYFLYTKDVHIGDRIIFNGTEYINKTGTITATAPDTDTTNWQINALQNVITVAKSGGDYTSVKAAVDDASVGSTVIVYPGVYAESNPIQGKTDVTLKAGGGQNTVVIQATNADANLFNMVTGFVLEDLTLTSVSGTGVYAVDHTTAGFILLDGIIIENCSNGIHLNNAGGQAILDNVAFQGTLTNGIHCEAGNIAGTVISVVGNATIATLVNITGANSRMNATGLITESSTLTTAILADNGATVTGAGDRILNCVDGIVVQGNNTEVRLDGLQMSNVQNDGFRINNTGTGIILGLFATSIFDSGRYNFNIENANCTVIGNGYTQIDKSYIDPDASFYAYLLDIKEADEGLNVLGELHVGLPERPAESAFGGGDSYNRGMLVYTETTGGVFADVTTEASSPSGSLFTFPGTGADNAIYMTSSLSNGTDFLLHPGIKMSITTATVLGAGNIIAEYWNGASWQEMNGMVTDSSEPFLPYGKDYFSRTGNFQLRYDIVTVNGGSWTKNDPMLLGTSYYWMRFRITSLITTAPVFQQYKLHTPRSEFNSDGFLEYFGDARPYNQLPVTVGSGRPFEGNMQSQSLWLDENIGVGHTTNRFTATGDIYGWEIISPNSIDTSSEMVFRWCVRPTATATLGWTVRWSWLSPDGTIYIADPGTGANPNSKSTTVSKSVTSGTLEWFQAYLDISDLIARRDTDFPDLMMISIQPTTLTGNVDLVGVQSYYLVWSGGGHAD